MRAHSEKFPGYEIGNQVLVSLNSQWWYGTEGFFLEFSPERSWV